MINGRRDLKIVHVYSATESQKQLIRAYLQGHVYDWCRNNPNQWFRACEMIGEVNKNWRGTPLQVLYDYYYRKGRGDHYAQVQAARAAGWLLWQVLVEDDRNFNTRPGYRRSYIWLR